MFTLNRVFHSRLSKFVPFNLLHLQFIESMSSDNIDIQYTTTVLQKHACKQSIRYLCLTTTTHFICLKGLYFIICFFLSLPLESFITSVISFFNFTIYLLAKHFYPSNETFLWTPFQLSDETDNFERSPKI